MFARSISITSLRTLLLGKLPSEGFGHKYSLGIIRSEVFARKTTEMVVTTDNEKQATGNCSYIINSGWGYVGILTVIRRMHQHLPREGDN